MPQLKIETFVSQYFWLVVILFGFYISMVLKVIPSIAPIAKIRSLISVPEESTASASVQQKHVITPQVTPIYSKKGSSSPIKAWIKA